MRTTLSSPYLAILIRPRSTMQEVLSASRRPRAWVLVCASSLFAALTTWLGWSLTSYVPGELADIGLGSINYNLVFAPIAVLSIPLSVLAWLLLSFACRSVGSWFGGRASLEDMRQALAWSSIASIGPVAALTILPAVFPATMDETGFTAWFYIINVIQLGASLWSAAVTVGATAAAHGFGLWRAIGTSLLAPALVTIGCALAVIGFGTLYWLFAR